MPYMSQARARPVRLTVTGAAAAGTKTSRLVAIFRTSSYPRPGSGAAPVHARIDLQAEFFLLLGELFINVVDGLFERLARVHALQHHAVPGVEDVTAGEVAAQHDRGLLEPAPLLEDRRDVFAGPRQRGERLEVGGVPAGLDADERFELTAEPLLGVLARPPLDELPRLVLRVALVEDDHRGAGPTAGADDGAGCDAGGAGGSVAGSNGR